MTVSDTAGSDGSATGSAEDGTTFQDISSMVETNTGMFVSDSNVVVVPTSSEHLTASTFTQSTVCCAVMT